MNTEILSYIKTLSDNEKTQELLIQTIGKILSNKNINSFFIQENSDKIIHIRDWISSIVENGKDWKTLRVLTIDALNNLADKYFEKKNNNLTKIELNETHEKLIEYLDEYYVVQMLTPQALDNESKNMQHCIGHGYYDHKLNNENYKYLSLRDKYNKAHVTLEIYKNNIKQLQGKQNKIPIFQYLNILIPWLKKNDYTINIEDYNLIINQNDNKLYSKYNLPIHCKTEKGLNFVNDFFNKIILPEYLTVNGNLNLSCSSIQKLPDNLTIYDSLDLSETKIKYLPKNLIVNNYINLSRTPIEELPDDFIVNNNLYLEDCNNIKKLPKNLTVKGNLILDCPNLLEIPEDIKIGKGLYLNYYECNIKKLPENLICQHIYINNRDIELINENITFEKIHLNYNTYTKKEFFEEKTKKSIDKLIRY